MGVPGPTGPTGADGASAYELAVSNGYTGTEQQWLATFPGSGGGGLTAADAGTIAAQGDATTLASAKTYADARLSALNDDFAQYSHAVDLRFARTDTRIDRMGAMGGAMAAAALNTAGLPGTNRVGVGVGMQNGRSAMAVGYQRVLLPNVSVSLSGAFSGKESSVAAGAGFSW